MGWLHSTGLSPFKEKQNVRYNLPNFPIPLITPLTQLLNTLSDVSPESPKIFTLSALKASRSNSNPITRLFARNSPCDGQSLTSTISQVTKRPTWRETGRVARRI
jgi:hypothetical protein